MSRDSATVTVGGPITSWLPIKTVDSGWVWPGTVLVRVHRTYLVGGISNGIAFVTDKRTFTEEGITAYKLIHGDLFDGANRQNINLAD